MPATWGKKTRAAVSHAWAFAVLLSALVPAWTSESTNSSINVASSTAYAGDLSGNTDGGGTADTRGLRGGTQVGVAIEHTKSGDGIRSSAAYSHIVVADDASGSTLIQRSSSTTKMHSESKPLANSTVTVLGGANLKIGDNKGRYDGGNDIFIMWGATWVEGSVSFPVSGVYSFELNAGGEIINGVGAHAQIFTDYSGPKSNINVDAGITLHNYTVNIFVPAGNHPIHVNYTNPTSNPPRLFRISRLTIRLVSRAAVNMSGTRDPWLQPFGSSSLWNTAIGSGAQWSLESDPDTQDVTIPDGTINAGQWSQPFYLGSDSDPLGTLHDLKPWGWWPVPDSTIHIPAEATPDPALDRHIILFNSDKREMFQNFDCVRNLQRGFDCSLRAIDDVGGSGLGMNWGSGVIRKWEIEAGVIRHMLRYALPKSRTKSGGETYFGQAWPLLWEDGCGTKCYTGNVLFGSTVGIPSTVDITSLGLTPSGLMLSRALQDYGAVQTDTGGEHGIIFYAEGAAEGTPQLSDMRSDMDKITPHLRIMRNQGPTSINGGGMRRQPPIPEVSSSIVTYIYQNPF